MSKTPPIFYVFHGDDDLRMDDEIARFRKLMGDGPNAEMNIAEFDGTATDIGEILGAATSYPFLAEKRLVIVRNLLTWITRSSSSWRHRSICR